MSDRVTPEILENAKRRDARIRMIDEGFQIEAEVRDSATIRHILGRVTTDADQAMEELSEVSPLDNITIAKLLVRIQTLVYIRRSLKAVQQQTILAAQSIQAEEFDNAEGESPSYQ